MIRFLRIQLVLILAVLFLFPENFSYSTLTVNVPEAFSGFQRPIANNHSGYTFLQYAQYGNYWIWHPGWDYNGSGSGNSDAGQIIYSVADGLVVFAPSSKPTQWGSIVIQHLYKGEAVYSQYGHMRKVYVKEGDIVSKGDAIGELGGVPNFSAHLHWEIRKSSHPSPTNANYWNPKAFQSKDTINSWYYNPEWWVDNHGPYVSAIIFDFNGVGDVKLGDSVQKLEQVFGSPKEVESVVAWEWGIYALPQGDRFEVFEYDGVFFYIHENKVVFFGIESDKYQSSSGITAGSPVSQIPKLSTLYEYDEFIEGYYFRQEERESQIYLDQQGNIGAILIGFPEYFSSL